jgi:preprotein translocase subunit SecE
VQRRRGQRSSIGQFFREVREEMRQVAWPSRPELINYTTIVLFVLIFMTALIFGLGFGFSKFVTFLFTK